MLIDAHCHLTAKEFDQDREQIMKKAQAQGVCAFFSAATDQSSWLPLIELAVAHDNVSVSLGLHPWFNHSDVLNEQAIDKSGGLPLHALAALEVYLKSPPKGMVAVGECGVDSRSESDSQWALFDAQLALAERYQLPIVIHCVRLNDQVAALLRRYPGIPGGLIHGYAGSVVQATRFLDQGYLIGLGGSVTYERAKKLQGVARSLPNEGFVIESDSPDGLPSMLKGKVTRNTPSSIPLIAQLIAELRNTSPQEVAKHTSRNACNMFDLQIGASS